MFSRLKKARAFMSIRVHWWFGLMLVCDVSAFAAPLALSKNDEASREAAVQWLQVLDSAKYNDAAEMMAQEVRNQRDWSDYFTKRRAWLGRASKRHLTEMKHTSTLPGVVEVRKYAIMRFKTSFERESIATEEVTIAKLGCCWEVFGYQISDK
jgi:uncharacterized protein DUF4019